MLELERRGRGMTGDASLADRPIPTGLKLTNLDPDFRENPYPILAELRVREPVHHDEVLGRYVLTTHEDVSSILRDLELWSDPRKANPETFIQRFASVNVDEEPSMLLMDDPGHRRLRDLVRRSFTPRAVENWREWVRGVAERLVRDMQPGALDVIADFADPLPAMVIAEMLGLDPASHGQFKEWSDIIAVVGFNPAPEPAQTRDADRARDLLDQFFLSEIGARRRKLGDDLISDMVGAELDGDQLTDEEIVRQCNLLLLAGNITTTDLIGNAIKALIDHPEQMARLRSEPELLPNAIEEVLRFESPVTASGRIANRAFEIRGVTIPKGENLSVMLAAANRDPVVHPDPDRFDVAREEIHHQSFGGGRHFCLGAHLARIEAQEAVRALLGRFRELHHDAEGGHRWAATPTFRGLERLWVEAS
jgi:cytochrome P450